MYEFLNNNNANALQESVDTVVAQMLYPYISGANHTSQSQQAQYNSQPYYGNQFITPNNNSDNSYYSNEFNYQHYYTNWKHFNTIFNKLNAKKK